MKGDRVVDRLRVSMNHKTKTGFEEIFLKQILVLNTMRVRVRVRNRIMVSSEE